MNVPKSKNSRLALLPALMLVLLSRSAPANEAPSRSTAATPQGAASGEVPDLCLADKECRTLYETARRQSKAGQLEEALTSYQAAYARRSAPWLLISIGRIYHRLQRFHAALVHFQQYLQLPQKDTDVELRTMAEAYLQEVLLLNTPSSPPPDATSSAKPPAAATPSGNSSPGPALGNPDGDPCLSDSVCKELYDSARRSSDGGQLDEALRSYRKAYALKPVPWLLISIGRVYHKLARFDLAVINYQMYLDVPVANADPELRGKAEKYIHESEQKQEEQRLQAAADREPPPTLAAEPSPALLATPSKRVDKPIYKRWWFWTAIAGAAAVGVGLGVGLGTRKTAPDDPAGVPIHDIP